jgi:predicted Rdx family selenoprotein
MRTTQRAIAIVTGVLLTLITLGNGYCFDEKNALRNSYFGNFNGAKIAKKVGKVTLRRWEPYVQHVRSLPGPYVEPEGISKITIDYDEIWIRENDEGFPPHMKKRLRGQLDINKLYWKQNQIQASTLEKYFLGNPVTGATLNPPAHKVVVIYGRDAIINKIK